MKPSAAATLAASPACVTDWRDGRAAARDDWLAEETPVALVFNGITQAVMLASPGDLEDFALGFAITEGLVTDPADLYGVDVHMQEAGIELRIEVSSACAWRLKAQRRARLGPTGCGLCGIDSLAQLQRTLPQAPDVRLQPAALGRALRAMRSHQPLQQRTGATHAAAWCAPEGALRLLREDVGRHNALDKLVGAMRRAGEDPAQGFVALTSRASFEMIEKTAAAGIGALAAVSAPTALAVRRAQALGVALAGFVRGDDAVAYTFAQRFGLVPDGR